MSNSLVFNVTKSAGGVNLEAKEWYPCVLTGITMGKATFNGVESDQLTWDFELQGEEYQLEFGGKVKQFSVRGKTSTFTTPKSKMYTWYTELIGEQLEEGAEINLESIIGTKCDIMVLPQEYTDKVTKKQKTAYKIEMLRRSKSPKPVQKPVATPQVSKAVVTNTPKTVNPGGVTSPEDIQFTNGVEEAQVTSPDAIFKGIL